MRANDRTTLGLWLRLAEVDERRGDRLSRTFVVVVSREMN
jgi:hypothetical protein